VPSCVIRVAFLLRLVYRRAQSAAKTLTHAGHQILAASYGSHAHATPAADIEVLTSGQFIALWTERVNRFMARKVEPPTHYVQHTSKAKKPTKSTLSSHLSILARSGLVRGARSGCSLTASLAPKRG
jgi:hypothetical protein